MPCLRYKPFGQVECIPGLNFLIFFGGFLSYVLLPHSHEKQTNKQKTPALTLCSVNLTIQIHLDHSLDLTQVDAISDSFSTISFPLCCVYRGVISCLTPPVDFICSVKSVTPYWTLPKPIVCTGNSLEALGLHVPLLTPLRNIIQFGKYAVAQSQLSGFIFYWSE